MSKNKIVKFLLEAEESGKLDIDIGYRGGHYGLRADAVVEFLFGDSNDGAKENIVNLLPEKVGVFCNYLGGGLRGSISGGGYNENLPAYVKKLIDKFVKCCKERYLEIESGTGLNEEEDENGEKNWDAIGSNRCRFAGVVSAY